MSKIEKIQAYIERLMEENNNNPNVYDFGCERACKLIKSFIDSMQSESKLRLGDKVRNKTLGVEGVVFDIGKDGVINVDCGVYQDYNINIDDWELVEDAADDINVSADKEIRKYMTEHFNLYEDGVLQSKNKDCRVFLTMAERAYW